MYEMLSYILILLLLCRYVDVSYSFKIKDSGSSFYRYVTKNDKCFALQATCVGIICMM